MMTSRSVVVALLSAALMSLATGWSHQQARPAARPSSRTLKLTATVVNTPTKSTTPNLAATTSIRWNVSDHQQETPKLNSIRFTLTFGDYALVALSVPRVEPTWHQYIALKHTQSGWQPRGILDAPMATPVSSGSQGLDLPFTTFIEMHGSPYEGGITYWIFEHYQKSVIVTRTPRSPMNLRDWRQLPGTHRYVKQSKHSRNVLELDEGYWIEVSGNVPLNQLQHVLKSLQQASSGTFPFADPSGPTTKIR